MSDGHLIWRTLASRVIVSDQWLTLRADTCETRDGVRIDPYYVVDSPDFVVMIAVTSDDQLVLVRQYRHAAGAVTLELPAGRVDPGEEPLEAARRELAEETGHAGGSARLLRSLSPNAPRFSNQMHLVLIEGVDVVAAIKEDAREQVETVLWPLARADELYGESGLTDATLVGALALGLRALGRD
jgi:8-oxo-dGTP pyrophosphatase MutT (NUDIX family)